MTRATRFGFTDYEDYFAPALGRRGRVQGAHEPRHDQRDELLPVPRAVRCAARPVIPEIAREQAARASNAVSRLVGGLLDRRGALHDRDDAARLGARGARLQRARCSAPTSRRRRSSVPSAAVYPARGARDACRRTSSQRWFEPVEGGYRPRRARPRPRATFHYHNLIKEPYPLAFMSELGRHLLPQRHDLLPARVDARVVDNFFDASTPAATCSSATPRRSPRSRTGSRPSRSAASSCTASRSRSTLFTFADVASAPGRQRSRAAARRRAGPIVERSSARAARTRPRARAERPVGRRARVARHGAPRQPRPMLLSRSAHALLDEARPAEAPASSRRGRSPTNPDDVEAHAGRRVRARGHRQLRDGAAQQASSCSPINPLLRPRATSSASSTSEQGDSDAAHRRVQEDASTSTRTSCWRTSTSPTSIGSGATLDDACREYENTLRALVHDAGRVLDGVSRRVQTRSAGQDVRAQSDRVSEGRLAGA